MSHNCLQFLFHLSSRFINNIDAVNLLLSLSLLFHCFCLSYITWLFMIIAKRTLEHKLWEFLSSYMNNSLIKLLCHCMLNSLFFSMLIHYNTSLIHLNHLLSVLQHLILMLKCKLKTSFLYSLCQFWFYDRFTLSKSILLKYMLYWHCRYISH